MIQRPFDTSFGLWELMITAEIIQKLCLDESPETACKHILKVTKESPEAFKDAVVQISKQISLESKPANVPKYFVVLTNVLRQGSSRFAIEELADWFKAALPLAGRPKDKRVRRFALILSLAAISRAGLIKDDFGQITNYIGLLIDIAQNFPCYRLMCYQIILDIIDTNVHDADLFMDSVLPVLDQVKQEFPENVDLLYFWIKLSQTYSKIPVSEDLHNPLSKASLSRMEELLQSTRDILPTIHPIWFTFAEINPTTLIQHLSELWIDSNPHKVLIMMAVTASISYMGQNEILDLITNQKVFLCAVSSKKNDRFKTEMNAVIRKLIASSEQTASKIFTSLLNLSDPKIKNGCFITEILNDSCSALSDDQNRKLLQQLTDSAALQQFLWIQKHRKTITDYSILVDTIKSCSSHGVSIDEISRFISVTMTTITTAGHTWFSIFADGVELPSSDKVRSLEALVQATNEVIPGINTINQLIGVKGDFEPIGVSLDAFDALATKLLKSKYEYHVSIANILITKAFPLLDASKMRLLSKNPELMALAAQDSKLAASVLPMLIECESLSRYFPSDKRISFPVTAEEAVKILPGMIQKCHGLSKHCQERIVIALFSLIDDDSCSKIIKDQLDRILDEDKKHGFFGVEALSELAKVNTNAAMEILTILTQRAPKIKSINTMKIVRSMMTECIDTGEIPVDAIEDAIFASINQPYDSSNMGRKKVEAALKWAQKEIKKAGPNINRERFSALVDNVVNTQSRAAANMIHKIINAK